MQVLRLESFVASLIILALLWNAAFCVPTTEEQAHDRAESAKDGWSSLLTATELNDRLRDANVLVIDARSPQEYAAGHIPGSINLPGVAWRTPATKPGSGKVGQQLFRTSDGKIDVARYEAYLGNAGVTPEHRIIVYGNHAGKADGSVAASILLKLGHEDVAFLDGVGIEEWRKAGYPISTEQTTLPAAKYRARPDLGRLWTRDDVLKNLDNQNVVIIDSRTPAEYRGDDLRGNQRGGHIPGAILLDSEEFLEDSSHTTIAPKKAREKIEAVIPKDKTVVIYCQSGTRCSHKELILRDLGYENVVLYDGSWQDWGNREDTPVEKEGP